jgi:hypothetical protein
MREDGIADRAGANKNAPEGASLCDGWRGSRDCINNLLRSKSIVFWWRRGFELGSIQDLKNQARHDTLASVPLA